MENTTPAGDKVRLVVIDAASGDHYRMSTRTVPDKLIFARSRTLSNAHELEIPLSEWEQLQADIGLRPAGSNAHVLVYFMVDEAAHSGGDEIAALRAQLEELTARHDKGIAALGKELDEARGQNPQGSAKGLSADDVACLIERDALITLLMPYIEDPEHDTPVGVLTKVLAKVKDQEHSHLLGPDGKPFEIATADEQPPIQTGATTSTEPEKVNAEAGTGHAPIDAHEAGPNGEPPGKPIVAGEPGSNEKKPEPVEFDRAAFAKTLSDKEVPELRGMAAPAGIPNYANMNARQLRKSLVEYEVKRHAVKPQAPTNTARPDGEQPHAGGATPGTHEEQGTKSNTPG